MRPKRLTVALHVVPWTALLLLPYAFHTADNNAPGLGAVPVLFFTITNILNIGFFYFNALFFFPGYCNARRWYVYVPGILAALVGVFYLKSGILSAILPDIRPDDQVERMLIWSGLFVLLLSIVYRLGFDAVRREQQIKERDAEHLVSELQLLRARISPHFFFNVLNNLVAMARAKSDKLESSLLRLSDIMRYVLYEANDRMVPVEREIEYLKSYIELQKMRFQDVRINVDIRNNGSSLAIEPLLLIPFVENAFKHGAGSLRDPFIDVKLTVERSLLRLDVSNRIGNPGTDRHSGIGLKNVEKRLGLAYPGRYHLSLHEEGDVFWANLVLELQ